MICGLSSVKLNMQKGIPPKIVRMWAAQVPALAAIRKEMETMLSFKLIVTLAVVVFMTISLVIHKVPYGITGMTCVVILAFAGALDAKSAFSGFSNTTVILVATMMVIAGALGKTSVVSRVRKLIGKAQGKKGIVLILILSVITIVLTQLMGMTAVMAILLTFVQTLDPDGELCPSRMLFLLACVLCTWFGRFPVGIGAALPLATNAYYEGLVEGHPEYLLGVFDFFKVGIVPSIVLTIYCLLGWKLIPKGQLDASALNMPTGGQKEAEPMSGKKEAVVIGVFLATMVGFFLSSQLGGLIYIIPVAGILLFYYFGVMTVPELVNGLTGDMIWMVASMMAVTNAMSASGAGELIGQTVLKILGDNPSGIMVVTVFTLVSVLMTTFMSNNATIAILTPIAVSTALAGGMNPRAIATLVSMASCLAVAFPTGCAASMIAFGAGGYSPAKLLKFTIPYLILGTVSLIISANIFFPVYG